MGRAEIRKQLRRDRADLVAKHQTPYQMKRDAKIASLLKNGITPDDLEKEYAKGYQKGFSDAGTAVLKICYASMCLMLHKQFGFGQGRLFRALTNLDQEILQHITSEEAADQVFQQTGLTIQINDPIEPVGVVKPVRLSRKAT